MRRRTGLEDAQAAEDSREARKAELAHKARAEREAAAEERRAMEALRDQRQAERAQREAEAAETALPAGYSAEPPVKWNDPARYERRATEPPPRSVKHVSQKSAEPPNVTRGGHQTIAPTDLPGVRATRESYRKVK